MRRGLLPYATAATIARSATEAIPPAVLLVAVATGSSAANGALLLSCYVAAGALAGPFVGAALDRTSRPKRALGAAMGLLAASLVGVALGLGHFPFWLLAILAGLAGLGQPAPTSGWTAQLPRIVSERSISGAYALDSATYNIGMIAGPGLAGVAILLGKREPLLVPVALICIAIVVLAFVPIAPLDTSQKRENASIRRGFTVMMRQPLLLRSSITSTLGLAGQAALVVAAPDISSRFSGDLNAVGPLFVALAIGGLLSSLYLARRPMAEPDRWVAIGTAIIGLGFVLLAFANSLALTFAAAFVVGLGDGPMFTATLRIRAREAPIEVRSQVFATAASFRVGSYALALAGLGALLHDGIRTVLLAGAAVAAAAVFLGWLSTAWRVGKRKAG